MKTFRLLLLTLAITITSCSRDSDEIITSENSKDKFWKKITHIYIQDGLGNGQSTLKVGIYTNEDSPQYKIEFYNYLNMDGKFRGRFITPTIIFSFEGISGSKYNYPFDHYFSITGYPKPFNSIGLKFVAYNTSDKLFLDIQKSTITISQNDIPTGSTIQDLKEFKEFMKGGTGLYILN